MQFPKQSFMALILCFVWTSTSFAGYAPATLNGSSVFVAEESGNDAFEMVSNEITSYQKIGKDTATFILQEIDGDVFHEALLFNTTTSGIYVETQLVDTPEVISWQNQVAVVGVFSLTQQPNTPSSGNGFAPAQLPSVNVNVSAEDGSDSFFITPSEISDYIKLGSDTSSFILSESDGDVFQEILFFETPNSGIYIETKKVNKGVDIHYNSQSSVVGTFGFDADNDGVADISDNCPLVSNVDQTDADSDGVGDACDACIDIDNDEICGDADNCPSTSNVDQLDSDQDGIGDVCDLCPNDPNDDADSDGVCGDVDNCPVDANETQRDNDKDSIGDVCDVCPRYFGNYDADSDGIADCLDNNDTDTDGYTDSEEAQCGSDPLDILSVCPKALPFLMLLLDE